MEKFGGCFGSLDDCNFEDSDESLLDIRENLKFELDSRDDEKVSKTDFIIKRSDWIEDFSDCKIELN